MVVRTFKETILIAGILTFSTFAFGQDYEDSQEDQDNSVYSSNTDNATTLTYSNDSNTNPDISSLFLISPSQLKFRKIAGLDMGYMWGRYNFKLKNDHKSENTIDSHGARVQFYPELSQENLFLGFYVDNWVTNLKTKTTPLSGNTNGAFDGFSRSNDFSFGANLAVDLGEISLGLQSVYYRDYVGSSRHSYSLTDLSMQFELIENTELGLTFAMGKEDENAGFASPSYLQFHIIRNYSDDTDLGFVIRLVQATSIGSSQDKDHHEFFFLGRKTLDSMTRLEGAITYQPKFYEDDLSLSDYNAETISLNARIFRNLSEGLWGGCNLMYTRISDNAGDYTLDANVLELQANLSFTW